MLRLFRAAPAAKRTEAASLPDLVVGSRTVPVELRRDARARRLILRADGVRGCLRVTLPPRVRIAEADALLAGHRAWIAAQVARWPAALPFAPGAAIPFNGGALYLDWAPGRPRGLERQAERLVAGGDVATLPGRVTRWLKSRALEELTAATMVVAGSIGRSATVRVGDPAGRWGSCSSTGRIAYSWRLILAPPDVRHSVVAHEVAHLVHPNHGPDFWALAAELNGSDPAPQRRWLKAHGAGLHWIGRPA